MQFQSLPSQVAAYLEEEIRRGRWSEFLPGERSLASSLGVSRRTLTAALGRLQGVGVVRAEPGRGHRIVAGPSSGGAAETRRIGLLTEKPLDLMRPGATVWVNSLQSLLGDAGFRLDLFHGRKYMGARPERSLAKLLADHPHACWVLAGSTEPTQRWFAQKKVPALVVGTRHGDVALPDVDVDFLAMGRHVAGRLVSSGHRRAAIMLSNSAGYIASESECERGFRAVLERAGGEALAVYHPRDRDGLLRTLRRLYTPRDFPTAVVVINSLDYLTTISFLTRMGLRVPEDISVVSRTDDAFMMALLPEPTRYRASPHALARRIFRFLLPLVEGRPLPRPHARIMPEFIPGQSLAAPGGPREQA